VGVQIWKCGVRGKGLGEIGRQDLGPFVPEVTGDAPIHPIEGRKPQLPHADGELPSGRDLGMLLQNLTEPPLNRKPVHGVFPHEAQKDEDKEHQRGQEEPPEVPVLGKARVSHR
jgi:hypothetical protein